MTNVGAVLFTVGFCGVFSLYQTHNQELEE